MTVALAIAIAGCGGGDKRTIPHDDAAKLNHYLRVARDSAGNPDKCDTLQSAVRRAKAQVDALPSSVDSDTRQSLDNGVANLADRARQDCANVQTTDTTPTTPTTPTVAPPTTTTAPPTNTEPNTDTAPTTPTTPPTDTTPTSNTQTQPPDQTVPGQGNGGIPPGQGGKGKGPKDAPGQQKKAEHGGKEHGDKGPKK
jgi:hypothetical protein